MPDISAYLDALIEQKSALASNLTAMGVSASKAETFNSLVPKVLLISQGGGSEPSSDRVVLFNAQHRTEIAIKRDDFIYSLDDFITQYPDFCNAENGYTLNYSNMIFGWDLSILTCSGIPLNITQSSRIAMCFAAYSTESGILRLVKSDSGLAKDILENAQTEGKYIDLPFTWIYSMDGFVTTLTSCENVIAGTYYLAWVGRSNNCRPIIKSVEVM